MSPRASSICSWSELQAPSIDVLMQSVGAYLDKRLKIERKPSAA